MRPILVDSSSIILLYKSGWLDATVDKFHLRIGQAVYRELTVRGYPGADRFQWLVANERIEVLPANDASRVAGRAALDGLGPGEQECIRHFLAGGGKFILIDDGRGARFCRDCGLPYTNALLMPRILALADPAIDVQVVAQAMAHIGRLGRYADWVRKYAHSCEDAALLKFLP